MITEKIIRELHPTLGMVTSVVIRYSSGRTVKRIYDHKVSTKVPVAIENIVS